MDALFYNFVSLY